MTTLKVIGLISGTSMDGIDVAVAELRLAGGTVELDPLGHREIRYPTGLREALLAALPPGSCTAGELCRLDTEVGQAFAAAAAGALADLAGGQAHLVASLGQTIYRGLDERCRGTLRLDQPGWIAERTGLPVVAGLRARDVAAGGPGVPLAAILDQLWLAEAGQPVAALHLGGIATVTVVGRTAPALAFDTGPGNALLDAAARMISDGVWRQDVDGELAAQGRVRTDLLDRLLADAYYGEPPPKSTGKERFHAGYLRAALAGLPHVPAVDLLATLVELTAVTVADACRGLGVGRVVASGGGTRNPVLMAALRRALAAVPVVTSDEFGLPADVKQAYLATLLGFLTWCGAPRLVGSLTPGSTPLRLPDPVTTAVTRLKVAVRQGTRES